jgi:hypothetical protein
MNMVIAMFDAGVTLAIFVLAMLSANLGYHLIRGMGVYFRLRGTRPVACPEAHQAAMVELAAKSKGTRPVLGEPSLRIRVCSRWPMRVGCGQGCLNQIEARESELRFLSRLKHSSYSTQRT